MSYNNDTIDVSNLKTLITALVSAGWESSGMDLDVYKKAHVRVRPSVYGGTDVLTRTSRGGYALIRDLQHKLHGANAFKTTYTKVADFMTYVEARAAETPPPIDKTKPRPSKPLPKAQDFVDNLEIVDNILKTKSVCRNYEFIKVASINEKGQIEDALVPGVEPWIAIRVDTINAKGYAGTSVVIVNQKQWYQIQNYHYKSGNMHRIVKPRIILTHHDLEMITQLVGHCTT